ncbi:MAG: flagellar basal-body rod protein FlgC, partial [Acidobacteria bacterium]|nr:flagellar basal-body rod protein FlgC [Acidobacteriota bacterium]
MAGLYGVLDTSGSALDTFKTWMAALGDNVANVNTIKRTNESAFQARLIEVRERAGGGVEVAGVDFSNPEGTIVYDPTSPLADAKGEVRAPAVEMSDQMTSILAAQRGYQLNLAVIDRA